MKSTRREFLRKTGVTALGLAAAKAIAADDAQKDAAIPNTSGGPRASGAFNMCGYAAPKIDVVRVGLIGLGSRGTSALPRLSVIEGVEIKALCDVRPERVAAGLAKLASTSHKPETYDDDADAWRRVCERDDIDLIYNCTPWRLHAPISIFAMEHGKHAVTEIPAATTMEECWQLVETSERTRRHCMMLENCCYDFFELLTLNMAQQGYFGEIVHGEGAYLHDLRELNFSKEQYHDMWRLKENQRNGNLYPMHGLGPIAQLMNVNRGDRFDYLVSMQSADFQMAKMADELAASDPFFEPFAGKRYRGNMNTTTVRTAKGRTIMLQHDVTSPRPYSRLHTVVGTRAMAQKYPLPPRLTNGGHEWVSPEDLEELEERYTFELVKRIAAKAKQVGGHGGMDFIMDWRLMNNLRQGLPLDMEVYDAAAWTSVGLLSEVSVANRSKSVDVPDFTNGHWSSNAPVDLTRGLPA